MKIHPVGDKLSDVDSGWMDGWTDRHGKANNGFSLFCKCTQQPFTNIINYLYKEDAEYVLTSPFLSAA